MTITYRQITAVSLLLAAFLGAALLFSWNPALPADASVLRGGEYHATTTNSFTVGGGPTEKALLTEPGTLGSVVITGANSGTINLYDATTSNINARTGNLATSAILVASFPASAAAGTYTFDGVVVNGLYLSVAGTAPTSTITYR